MITQNYSINNGEKQSFLKKNKWALGVFFIALTSIVAYNLINSNKLTSNHLYGIGAIDGGIIEKGKLGYELEFTFNVKGKKFKGTYHSSDPESRDALRLSSLLKERYMVMFNPDDPTNCEILFNYPVPDSIENNGQSWKNLSDIYK